jgi:hypothetical protein
MPRITHGVALALLLLAARSAAFVAPCRRAGITTHATHCAEPYQGPLSSADRMEAAVEVQQLGLVVGVGESLVVPGARGLYVCAQDAGTVVHLQAFTLIAGEGDQILCR